MEYLNFVGGKVCALYTVGLCPTPNWGINFWDKFTWGGKMSVSFFFCPPVPPPKKNPGDGLRMSTTLIRLLITFWYWLL